MTESNRTPQPQPNQDFPSTSFVVGIGASAGGLQAIEAFFSSLLPEPGATFVVVQHLSPDYRSLIVELLQRRTTLPVYPIENGMAITVNNVYVLPPGFVVRLQGQQLWLEERQEGQIDAPIDYFFLSLAQERGDRCISILLSGTGHDGTEGLKAISRAGGVALVQSQDTTQFAAMPSSPLSSGLVDEILSPEELAQAVCDIIGYTRTQESLTRNSTTLLPPEQLTEILDILQRQENIDFSLYKPGTLNRRIIHRLLLSKVNTISEYITYLNENVEEVKNLRQDLLIGATRFFRDPEMWSLLQTEVLPSLLETLEPGNPLRLWVTGCSTGEEVYSLAIVVDEVMQNMEEKHPVKLFATDIDQEALTIASQGIYSDNIVQDIGAERLQSYFVAEGSTYRIKKSIRSQVVFASHDLTKNPGFSQMHLVSCRNLLIYMQSALQEQVLMLLHFSLARRGVLILGPAENLGIIPHAFDSINQQWKIFRKRLDVQLPVTRIIKSPTIQPVTMYKPVKSGRPIYETWVQSVFKLRFGEQPVTCVVVNQNHQIVHILINTARLLELPLGEMSTNILDIVPPSMKIPLSTALHRVKRDRQSIVYNDIQVSELESQQRINLWVGKVEEDDTSSEIQIIVLLELALPTESIATSTDLDFDPNSVLSLQIRELEFELQQTRENLQTTIEELETANEEQQATNEELVASNEELQSTNEELQSVNEELYTVNAENQERIEELTELSADIDNLLQSTDIGVVFLDADFNIRKYTPAAAKVFNFRMGDIGRPLTELVNYLDINNLISLVQQVAETQNSQELEATNVNTEDRLLLRILPYLREDGTSNGVVLTLVIVNDLKKIQNDLQRQAFFDTLTELANRAFFLETLKLSIARISRDTSYQFALLYLDIDGFKEVNDTLGHAAGDQLLVEVAERLNNTVRPGDIISRLGGDEFAILLAKTAGSEVVMEVASRIQSAIAAPLTIGTSQLSITVSIGIAFYAPDYQWQSDTVILENADIAMYEAKHQGPGNIALFHPSMRSKRESQAELKASLYQALEQEEFVLYYQPLIDFSSQSLKGFEALIRWQHPQRGLLAPIEFLPVVATSHLMPALENWIFKEACHQMSQWNQEFDFNKAFKMNINISPDFLLHPNFINNVNLAISESGVNPEQICLELTENSFIGHSSDVETLLLTIKRLGISIALDDFGTGYSSLSYLHRLPIDKIKIDQSFVQSFDSSSSLVGITRGIISLARQLELNVTAEGVETLEQFRQVQEFGCDNAQGYFFSHPVPGVEAKQLIENPEFWENLF
ncbi:MAG: EAL domain-containing protein [Okeania sp. SIO2F4]|nr:EAL domain-containing protein [Okeania sp. SIO2F4]NES04872.1 EAL domain-containing protein [Okeania sp. SIO2F4]